MWDDLPVKMGRRKWTGVLVVSLAAVLAGTAWATQGDPQKKFTKADQALARRISLRSSDLGAGWTGKPSTDKSSNPRCSTYNPDQSDLIETGDHDSLDFSRPDGTFVSSSVGVFKTAAMARAGYRRVAVPQLPGCFAEIFRKGITAPSKATIFFSGPLVFPHYGDRLNAYRIRASVKTPSGTVSATIDLVVFNRGRVDVAIIFLGIPSAVPGSFEQSIVARVAARTG
jgi:hypothetical protein